MRRRGETGAFLSVSESFRRKRKATNELNEGRKKNDDKVPKKDNDKKATEFWAALDSKTCMFYIWEATLLKTVFG